MPTPTAQSQSTPRVGTPFIRTMFLLALVIAGLQSFAELGLWLYKIGEATFSSFRATVSGEFPKATALALAGALSTMVISEVLKRDLRKIVSEGQLHELATLAALAVVGSLALSMFRYGVGGNSSTTGSGAADPLAAKAGVVDWPPLPAWPTLPPWPPLPSWPDRVEAADSKMNVPILFAEDSQVTLAPADAQIPLMRGLVFALATCLQGSADKVQLTVRAFTSSLGTAAENQTVAKQRLEYVATTLQSAADDALGKDALPRERFKITMVARKWRTDTTFLDQGPRGYIASAGMLNRRAEIQIDSAGACEHR